DQIRAAVQGVGFASPDVIRVNDEANPNRFLIRVQEVTSIEEAARVEIEQALCFGDALDPDRCPEAKQSSEVKFSPGGDKITVRFREAPNIDEVRQLFASGLGGVSLRGGDNNPSLQNARDNRVEIQLKSKGDQLIDGLREAL